MRYAHALNTEGLKTGSVYALNRKYALNNRVCLTTSVYGNTSIQHTNKMHFLIHSTSINAGLCVAQMQHTLATIFPFAFTET